MNKIVVSFLFVFLSQFVFGQNLSSDISTGNIENIISKTNSDNYSGKFFLEDINIFPNPFVEYVNVKVSNLIADELKVYIYNIKGELTQSMQINKSEAPIEYSVSLADLSTGLYFVEVRLGNYRAIKKINKI